jgi:hypothetical protein
MISVVTPTCPRITAGMSASTAIQIRRGDIGIYFTRRGLATLVSSAMICDYE